MANDSKVKVNLASEAPYPVWPDMMRYEKSSSYGPAQYNRLRAPIKGVEKGDWGGGSYHKNGRACSSLDAKGPGYNETSEFQVQPTTTRIK